MWLSCTATGSSPRQNAPVSVCLGGPAGRLKDQDDLAAGVALLELGICIAHLVQRVVAAIGISICPDATSSAISDGASVVDPSPLPSLLRTHLLRLVASKIVVSMR